MRNENLLIRSWPVVALVLITTLAALLCSAGSLSIQQAGLTMLINMVLVVGLYIFVGNSGLFSFGHTAFMAIGAYVTALVVMEPDVKAFLLPELPSFLADAQLTPVVAILLGAAIAAVAACLVGLPIVRMKPLPASLATFAVLAIVYNVAQNLDAVGGSSGLAQVPQTITIPGALAWALVAIGIAFAYSQTRSALRLRSSREDEVAARSIGVPVERDRYISFVISAFVAGLAGGVFALNFGSFTPSVFFLNAAFFAVVMLLVGGMTSLAGAVVGTIAVSLIQELLRRAEGGIELGFAEIPGRPGLQNVVLALLLLVTMAKRPLGLVGGREIAWPFRRRVSPSAGR
jgi:branched-chain amino acid transport system permease protein